MKSGEPREAAYALAMTSIATIEAEPGSASAPAGDGSGSLGGASIMLGVSVGAAIVLLFVSMLVVRRMALKREPLEAPEDPKARVDPWLEAGRRLQTPEHPGPDGGEGA
jgi:hypothetical protein